MVLRCCSRKMVLRLEVEGERLRQIPSTCPLADHELSHLELSMPQSSREIFSYRSEKIIHI